MSSFPQTVMERLETVIRVESYTWPGVFRRTSWWAEHPLLARGLGDLGHPLSWEVAEIGGYGGELLRMGTRHYHSHILVPKIVPSTNKYLLNAR